MSDETPKAESAGLKFKERYTLEKFDGDPPTHPGEKEPVERIVIEDGKVIERWRRDEADKSADPA